MEVPKFTVKLTNCDAKEGTTAKMNCTAKGKPRPEITWFKGEEPLEPTDRLKIDTKDLKGDSVSILSLEKCTIEDTMDVKAVAKNPAGEDTCQAKMTVTSKWRFLSCI